MGAYTVEIAQDSSQVKARVETLLEKARFQFAVSFDLQSARENAPCNCPHHGTSDCTCRYEIMLVSDPRRYPGETRTITIHGRDGLTWVSLVAAPATYLSTKSDRFGKKLRQIIEQSAATVKV